MKLPFQCVEVCGDVLFAARGGNIHSFKLGKERGSPREGGSPISCWRYPVEDKQNKATASQSGTGVDPQAEQEHGRPAKRVKLDAALEETPKGAVENPAQAQGGPDPKNEKEKCRAKDHSQSGRRPAPSERPLVNVLIATTDGRHVVAASQDKSVWVFEHDGNGNLKQLTRRIMPKRPCSLVVTPDNRTIISADKFGDVYSLPVTPSGDTNPEKASGTAALPSPARPKREFKPEASELTVHTKKNLEALAHQKKHNGQIQASGKTEVPTFERQLLLGHVSLLTCVVLGHHNGKEYIITADRDEHIRVSRGIPQTHVIESYCLGHQAFVNKLCIPERYPHLLISGGGDPDLYVWDWRDGKLLCKASLLSIVQSKHPDVTQIAVSGLWCWDGKGEEKGISQVIVACEGIPHLFSMSVKDENGRSEVSYFAELHGNPLDLDIAFTKTDDEELIVAVEPVQPTSEAWSAKSSLIRVKRTMGELACFKDCIEDQALAGDEELEDISEELHKMLYTAESLRKTDHEEGGAGGETQ